VDELLLQFLAATCRGHEPVEGQHRPFVDAAFLYAEYRQAAIGRAPIVDKKEFVQVIESQFPMVSLIKIGPHPHFFGLSYKTWVPKKVKGENG
jgi:hypothetical protein